MDSNSQHPYSLEQDGWNYTFVTRHGIKYHAYFLDYSIYHPEFENVYTFNFEPETDIPHSIDSCIALTITEILKTFFRQHQRALIMICDTLDGKELKRRALFDRWFLKHNTGEVIKFDASCAMEDYMLHVSLYVHKENPSSGKIISAFYELVGNNLYPLE